MYRALMVAAFVAVASGASAQSATPPDSATAAVGVPRRPLPDSIYAPLPQAEAPASAARAATRQWSRDQIFQTGALNLAELLATIPGVGVLRSGFILAPQVVTWWGDPGRVRVFLDGVELDHLDTRAGRARDAGQIDLWALEEVTVETSPSELRVHLRSWRVDRRVPETRVDVLTGDDDTNLYRGFYGRRFASGLALQFGFQQFSTVARRTGSDGDALSLFVRTGWSRGPWSADAALHRDARKRSVSLRSDEATGVPAFAGGTSSAILRAAFGAPDADGLWAQAIAATGTWREETDARAANAAKGIVADSADTLVSRRQYVASIGLSHWGLRLSGTGRYRTAGDAWYFTPSGRASFERWGIAVAAFTERNAEDSIARLDLTARVRLVRWVSAEVSESRRAPMWTNAEVANSSRQLLARVAWRGWEVGAGLASRPAAQFVAPTVFEAKYDSVSVPARTARILTATGPVYGPVHLGIDLAQWDSAGPYRPDLDARVRLFGETDWRRRFPRGDFTVRGAVEYRRVGAPIAPLMIGAVSLEPAAYWGTNLEIRIRTATISWQFRNTAGRVYETVAGYRMPQRVNLYGVRWSFAD